MTVALTCNLSDGVVLAVDSAVTVDDGAGSIVKVYENAEKLFQLGDRPIGVAVFGLGSLGERSIGSYLREFQLADPLDVVASDNSLADVVEGVRAFFDASYRTHVVPILEERAQVPFDQIPDENKPVLGLIVGGFSHGEFLSEVWETLIPVHDVPGSAVQHRPRGSFGTNWFAMFEPIRRYAKGYDLTLLTEVVDFIVQKRGGMPLDDDETQELVDILAKHEYQVPFAAMPMTEGVEHARMLAELVVSHHRFSVGAPVVGGKVQVGSVTYRGGRFQIHADHA